MTPRPDPGEPMVPLSDARTETPTADGGTIWEQIRDLCLARLDAMTAAEYLDYSGMASYVADRGLDPEEVAANARGEAGVRSYPPGSDHWMHEATRLGIPLALSRPSPPGRVTVNRDDLAHALNVPIPDRRTAYGKQVMRDRAAAVARLRAAIDEATR